MGHLLSLCQLDEIKIEDAKVVLAIDAPLGFPAAFRTLLLSEPMSGEIGTSAKNEYLYRLTERRLFSEGVQPLSAIKDMIGSQATKAMHVVAKFAPKSNEVGVWTDGGNFTVIETYPALCRDRLGHTKPDLFGREADIADARVCAHIAQEFRKRRENLEAPVEGVPEGEGWIWAPFRQ
ncbi:hypothetical protein [Roseovarius sp.]|uniref:hypothetical protein n=1 Tax=Roseovarius sp. TaxID=1486281 RepID=UPI003D0E3B9A